MSVAESSEDLPEDFFDDFANGDFLASLKAFAESEDFHPLSSDSFCSQSSSEDLYQNLVNEIRRLEKDIAERRRRLCRSPMQSILPYSENIENVEHFRRYSLDKVENSQFNDTNKSCQQNTKNEFEISHTHSQRYNCEKYSHSKEKRREFNRDLHYSSNRDIRDNSIDRYDYKKNSKNYSYNNSHTSHEYSRDSDDYNHNSRDYKRYSYYERDSTRSHSVDRNNTYVNSKSKLLESLVNQNTNSFNSKSKSLAEKTSSTRKLNKELPKQYDMSRNYDLHADLRNQIRSKREQTSKYDSTIKSCHLKYETIQKNKWNSPGSTIYCYTSKKNFDSRTCRNYCNRINYKYSSKNEYHRESYCKSPKQRPTFLEELRAKFAKEGKEFPEGDNKLRPCLMRKLNNDAYNLSLNEMLSKIQYFQQNINESNKLNDPLLTSNQSASKCKSLSKICPRKCKNTNHSPILPPDKIE